MPNLLQTNAAWLGEQLQTHAGQSCEYRHGAWAITANIVPVDGDSVRASGDLLSTSDISIRGDDYLALASSLEFDDVRFFPEVGDEIEWTEDSGQPRLSVVFPRVDQRCYRYHGPTDIRLRIHTVRDEDLITVGVETPGVLPFETYGIPATIRGQEIFDNDTSKLLMTSVYVPRSAFAANNIATPPLMATVTIEGDGRPWSVNMAETEWGPGLVKLGLQRETKVREWQARRNAAV